jgi:hypothetical protein
MRLRSLLAIVFLLFAQAAWAADDAPRVAILPLVPDEDRLPAKQDGEAIADYIQGQMQNFPGVVWVDRADLDAMLAEKVLTAASASDSSAIAMGRILKADLVIHGRYSGAQWERTQGGEQAYRRHLIIEVTDLTNASILASADLPLNSLANDGSDLNPDILKQCAETAQRLLTEALRVRRENASSIALAPLFFTNSGASPRLDSWDQVLIDRFTEISGSFPGTTILHFRGTQEASREQELSLLGLTDADPDVWQKAANGYIWGSYHEMAPDKTTAFEDIQVEAELFLMMGGKGPQRFTRTFAVKDFDKESRAMVAEILREAIANKNVAPSPGTGKEMAAGIFDHLCDWINAGFFTRKPDVAELMPHGFEMIYTGDTVFLPVTNQPFGDAKLEYCRHMLDLACFFDPQNARMQLFRDILSVEPGWDPTGTPDDQLTMPAQCINHLKRFVQDPDYDPALYASAVECVMDRCVTRLGGRFGLLPWRTFHMLGQGSWTVENTVPSGLTAERDAVLVDFYPLLVKQTPVMF